MTLLKHSQIINTKQVNYFNRSLRCGGHKYVVKSHFKLVIFFLEVWYSYNMLK